MTSISTFFFLFSLKITSRLLLQLLFMNVFFKFRSMCYFLSTVYENLSRRYNIQLGKRHDKKNSIMTLDDGKSNRLPDCGKQAVAATSSISGVYMAKYVSKLKYRQSKSKKYNIFITQREKRTVSSRKVRESSIQQRSTTRRRYSKLLVNNNNENNNM